MKYATYSLLALVIALTGAFGWFYFSHYRPLASELRSKDDELFTLQNLLDKAKADLEVKDAQLNETEARLEDLTITDKTKAEEIDKVDETYKALIDGMKKEIEEGNIEITNLKGELSVNVLDKILFDSGKTTIKKEGLEVLARVGDILKNVKNKKIVVEGHTDNVPISPALKSRFPTNWELSTARAVVVVRYLQEKVGIEPSLLWASGVSEYHPVADNATEEGKARNRRIEIILKPMTKSESQ
jgi:chemotaxis protein MotB